MNKIQKYIQDNEIEFEEIDLGDDELNDIKSNPLKLAKYYIKAFNQFTKEMKGCENQKVKSILSHNQVFLQLLIYSSSKNVNTSFGTSFYDGRIKRCVIENYDKIIEFIDLWEKLVE